MHEMSIALGMVDALYRIAEENKAGRISSVKLKIGKMSGIVADSLKFAFDAVKLEHPLLSEAEIIIEEVPLVYECNDCHVSSSAADIYIFACAGCGSRNLKLVSGKEQHIESVEVEV